MTRWTNELATALRGLTSDTNDDIASRAREYIRTPIGHEFEPFQVEYTHCLLQRLDRRVPSHTTFITAWENANAPR